MAFSVNNYLSFRKRKNNRKFHENYGSAEYIAGEGITQKA